MLELSLIVTNYDPDAGHYNPVDWNDIHEGDNVLAAIRLRGFVTLAANTTTNYWIMYKLPSGKVRAVGPFTPNTDELSRGWMVTPAPRCLFTEYGRLEVQALATNSSADISVIMDDYLNNRQANAPIMMWSKVYEFYIDESILLPTASEEVAPDGGLSPAAKAYVEDLVDELIAEGLEIDSALSATSQNAVQNRVIYDNLLTQKALDTAPFANSFANVNTSWITYKNDFTDLPGSGEYVLVNARYSQNYNIQLAFGYASVDKNFYWRIVNRNTHEVFVPWTTINRVQDLSIGNSISMGRMDNEPIGLGSTAIGISCIASGDYSLAQGETAYATSTAAHAEGHNTNATDWYAHAEGNGTEANAEASHAEGLRTRASSKYQHVEGKYNVEDDNNLYAKIVGNGTGSSNRSNAYTLDWDGNGWYAGTIKIGGTSYADAAEVATKEALGLKLAVQNETLHEFNGGIAEQVTNVLEDSEGNAIPLNAYSSADVPDESLACLNSIINSITLGQLYSEDSSTSLSVYENGVLRSAQTTKIESAWVSNKHYYILACNATRKNDLQFVQNDSSNRSYIVVFDIAEKTVAVYSTVSHNGCSFRISGIVRYASKIELNKMKDYVDSEIANAISGAIGGSY